MLEKVNTVAFQRINQLLILKLTKTAISTSPIAIPVISII